VAGKAEVPNRRVREAGAAEKVGVVVTTVGVGVAVARAVEVPADARVRVRRVAVEGWQHGATAADIEPAAGALERGGPTGGPATRNRTPSPAGARAGRVAIQASGGANVSEAAGRAAAERAAHKRPPRHVGRPTGHTCDSKTCGADAPLPWPRGLPGTR